MKCPECGGGKAMYQVMSGGELGYCPDCDDQFLLSQLPIDEQPLAVLLKTDAGRVALRANMDQRLAEKRDATYFQTHKDDEGEWGDPE